MLLFWAAACGGASTSPTPSPSLQTGCASAPGAVCYGRNNYVEYAVGDLPVVVSVPHGGALVPASIPDRTSGTTATDLNTIDLGRAIASAFVAATGRAPHVVICHLRRTKLDANREVVEAAQGNSEAIQAWTEYHAFIDTAIQRARAQIGRGFYIDLHGHGHAIPRLELGYLLSPAVLDLSDAELNAGPYAGQSSLAAAMGTMPVSFAELLRGPTSFGGLLASVPSVPSPDVKSPGTDPYFNGGYSTDRHTQSIPGLQIEAHYIGARDTPASRAALATALVAAVRAFAATHLALIF